MVELNNKDSRLINVHELKDGQIAEITNYPQNGKYENAIVQRYGNILICVGRNEGHSFTTLLTASPPINCKIRVLKEGEMLTIKDNQ